jgi:hypothetical protein
MGRREQNAEGAEEKPAEGAKRNGGTMHETGKDGGAASGVADPSTASGLRRTSLRMTKALFFNRLQEAGEGSMAGARKA